MHPRNSIDTQARSILTGGSVTHSVVVVRKSPSSHAETESHGDLFNIARQADRTVSYIIRAQLRTFLRE